MAKKSLLSSLPVPDSYFTQQKNYHYSNQGFVGRKYA